MTDESDQQLLSCEKLFKSNNFLPPFLKQVFKESFPNLAGFDLYLLPGEKKRKNTPNFPETSAGPPNEKNHLWYLKFSLFFSFLSLSRRSRTVGRAIKSTEREREREKE